MNYSLWQTFQRWKQKQQILRIAIELGFAFVLILISTLYGKHRIDEVNHIVAKSGKGIQVAAIQANIGDIDKIAAEKGYKEATSNIMETFIRLTDLAIKSTPRPELIVWPETSYPSTFGHPRSLSEIQLDESLESYVRQIGVPLLFGGYDRTGNQDFNALFLLSPQGEVQTYQKNILLLFGEYIPGADWIPFIKEAFPQVANFGRGEGPKILSISPLSQLDSTSIQMSPIICYEVLFSQYVRKSATQGSHLLINITNDSWFGPWGEPQLHLALSTFRSIETRLPLLRSTNTGISALITATGEITHPTSMDSQTILNTFIPITPNIPTLIKSWGEWFAPLSLFLGSLFIGFFCFQTLRMSKK